MGEARRANLGCSFLKGAQKVAPIFRAAKARVKKPLKIPDERKKRRGGKRQRRLKEKYGLSDLHKERIASVAVILSMETLPWARGALRATVAESYGRQEGKEKARPYKQMRRTLESSQQHRGKSALLN